jgi:hypothetical protein
MEGEEWDDSWVRYTYEGLILTAIYENNTWFSQALLHGSGEIALANASYNTSSGVRELNGLYQYVLNRDEGEVNEDDEFYDLTNTEFHFAIYG